MSPRRTKEDPFCPGCGARLSRLRTPAGDVILVNSRTAEPHRENCPQRDLFDDRPSNCSTSLTWLTHKSQPPSTCCECDVSKQRTNPPRSVCGLPGTTYDVTGLLGVLRVAACPRHAKRLVRLGYLAVKVPKQLTSGHVGQDGPARLAA